jgi:PAS domain S-box-containing protein
MPDTITREEALALLKDPKKGVLMGDLWGYISNVNKAIVELFGAKSKSELIGKHVLNFLIKEEREHAVQNSMDSIMNNKGKTQTYKVRLNNGEIVSLEVQTILILNKIGEKTGFIDIVKSQEQNAS